MSDIEVVDQALAIEEQVGKWREDRVRYECAVALHQLKALREACCDYARTYGAMSTISDRAKVEKIMSLIPATPCPDRPLGESYKEVCQSPPGHIGPCKLAVFTNDGKPIETA